MRFEINCSWTGKEYHVEFEWGKASDVILQKSETVVLPTEVDVALWVANKMNYLLNE